MGRTQNRESAADGAAAAAAAGRHRPVLNAPKGREIRGWRRGSPDMNPEETDHIYGDGDVTVPGIARFQRRGKEEEEEGKDCLEGREGFGGDVALGPVHRLFGTRAWARSGVVAVLLVGGVAWGEWLGVFSVVAPFLSFHQK
ncbi:hypothetical protein NL676_012633 [Syzygium grande]|nr:hypothetical protein NL676_012633 [Syzygium grande]